MVLAEIIFKGIPISNHVARGKAVVLQEAALPTFPESCTDGEAEVIRLQNAVSMSKDQLILIINHAQGQQRAIMESHLTLVEDPSIVNQAVEKIRQHSFTAEKAIYDTIEELYQEFCSMEDAPYLQERADDIQDIGRRIIDNLVGIAERDITLLEENTILIGQNFTPSQTARLDKSKVLAVVTATGGKTSHTAIMAKSMGIAAVVGCDGVLGQVQNGDDVIVDGVDGVVVVRPRVHTRERYAQKQETFRKMQERSEAVKFQKLSRSDGTPLLVTANIGTVEDAKIALDNGADAIGLFRTEFLFMDRENMPTEEEQYQAYRCVAEMYGNAPVHIRTLDIGGDKSLPYLKMPVEENPYLGVRAIRLCMQHKELFRTQLRAILRASAYGNLWVMFPMISSLEEFHNARQLLTECAKELSLADIPYNPQIPVGIMVELPASAILADAFARQVDFFSIGTNDLTQYTLAVDRGNLPLQELYNPLHPAVLQMIQNTIRAAKRHGIPCGVCGEMAGDKQGIGHLFAYGLNEFSVGCGIVSEVKEAISRLLA